MTQYRIVYTDFPILAPLRTAIAYLGDTYVTFATGDTWEKARENLCNRLVEMENTHIPPDETVEI